MQKRKLVVAVNQGCCFFLSQKASGLLQVIFLFGPENEEDQMNKPQDSITKVQGGQTDLEEVHIFLAHFSLSSCNFARFK